ncbi:hypothetical protein KXR53_21070 [Inquilinus limosus]|uniref:antitoxin n=1 Tax=Inquilinus limosus TaxID=171674 RepID=UPI003F157B99
MSDTAIAQLFRIGRSQAVRLPEELRLPGKEVRVRRYGRGVLPEPIEQETTKNIQAVFAEIDRLRGVEFLPEQPPMPPADDVSLDE